MQEMVAYGLKKSADTAWLADESIINILIQFCSNGKQQKRETKAKTWLQYMNK